MNFARRVLMIAGIYGLVVLIPLFFLEDRIGSDHPPAITHPEHYYGFLCVTLAWQAFLLFMAQDPVRYRPLLVPATLEKERLPNRRHHPARATAHPASDVRIPPGGSGLRRTVHRCVFQAGHR